MKLFGRKLRACAAAVCLAIIATTASAQQSGMRVELNKLESDAGLCRVYMIFENGGSERYTAFVMELFAFDNDGIIQKYLKINVAPLRPNKMTIKVFDVQGVDCADFSKIVLNDISQCSVDGGAVDNCLERMTLDSKASAGFAK